jgi:hypothetical protein
MTSNAKAEGPFGNAALGIERTHSESVRIGLGILARDSQFFGGPNAKELVEANRFLPVVGAGHSDFSGCRLLNASN